MDGSVLVVILQLPILELNAQQATIQAYIKNIVILIVVTESKQETRLVMTETPIQMMVDLPIAYQLKQTTFVILTLFLHHKYVKIEI